MNMNRWIISFLELTFLDHIFSTQIGGSFLFWNLAKQKYSKNVSSKKEMIHQFVWKKYDPKMQVPKKK